jgi:hypothetical protein
MSAPTEPTHTLIRLMPTIHSNGTARGALLDQLADACIALLEAERALYAAAPNARDYYPQGPDAYQKASAEHVSRLERIHSVRAEIAQIAESIGRPAMSEYTISVLTDDGAEHVLTGTLEDLQAMLAELGYRGPSVRVCDEAGFTRGWVSATHWRAE